MKKYLFALAAIFMMVCTAVTFTSCSSDSDDSEVVYYQVGWSEINANNLSIMEQIENIYTAQFKNLQGATYDGSYIKYNNGAHDSAIKSACSAAEKEIMANVTTPISWGYGVYSVTRIGSKGKIDVYSKIWGTK